MSDHTTNVALAGFGAWGQMHAKAINTIPKTEVSAIFCRSQESRLAASRLCPNAQLFDDYDVMLNNTNDAIINVCVPNALHTDYAIAALRSGHNVFLEKPIGISVEECERLATVVRDTGQLVSINHELRVSNQWGRIKELIASNCVGNIKYQNFSLYRHKFRNGNNNWRFDQKMVGSWLLEELVHFVDLILWYDEDNGLPNMVKAHANGSHDGLPENIACTIHWKNGAFATINQCLSGFEHHVLFELAGSDGGIRTWWSGAEDRTNAPQYSMRRSDASGNVVEEPIAFSGEAFELRENLQQAYQGFLEGRAVLSVEEASQAVVVCLACEEAIRTGNDVYL